MGRLKKKSRLNPPSHQLSLGRIPLASLIQTLAVAETHHGYQYIAVAHIQCGLYPEATYPTMFFKVELQILDNFVTDTTGSYLLTQNKIYSCGLQDDDFWNEPWFIPNP